MLPFNKRKNIFVGFVFATFLVAFISCNNSQQTTSVVDDSVQQTNASSNSTDSIKSNDTSRSNKSITENKDWFLIPGVSAGQTKIDEDADSVYQRLGKPDGGDAAMMKAVAIWYNHHDTTSHSIAIYTQRGTDSGAVARVLQIRITSPSFKTKEGIGATSSLDQIQKAFTVKKTEQYSDAGKNYDVYDSPQGIAFEMDAKQARCVAIVIHKSGVLGEGTYLKFRTTNQYINQK